MRKYRTVSVLVSSKAISIFFMHRINAFLAIECSRSVA
uniref:Uncharacterized protein n=1 Tax=Arundo donax TaxID=35708 RepID=A0A0A9EG58_ARUDO